MRYTTEIIIELPREQVIDILNNPENMKHWQRGLLSYKILSGTPGEQGAQMRLDYQMGKRKMILTETITTQNLPSEFHANYDSRGVHNIQRNFFYEIDGKNTRWVSESEFKFESLSLKILGWLIPGIFKKQSLKYLIDFKNFAEQGISVGDGR